MYRQLGSVLLVRVLRDSAGMELEVCTPSLSGRGIFTASYANLADAVRLRFAIRSAGGTALDPQVVRRFVARRRKSDPIRRLTPREDEVLALIAGRHSNTAISQSLVVSTRAVEKHVTGIFMKLGIPISNDKHHRRVMAVARYLNSE